MDACTLCSMMLILYICSIHESGCDLYMCVCIPFQVDDGESDDDYWDMSSSSSSESDVEAGQMGGYYDITYFLKK